MDTNTNRSAESNQPRRGTAWVRFWDQVTEGYALNQLWEQFKSDVRSSYSLYSAEIQAQGRELETTPLWRQRLRFAKQFAIAIFMKLSPARRVLLLLALVLLVMPGLDRGGDGIVVSSGRGAVGGALLLLLLIGLEISDRLTMKRDLEIARDIQHWLMPEKAPVIEGYDVAFVTRPANTVAGDYYDVLRRPGLASAGETRDPILLCVADVVGKSMPAALLMATFQAGLRTLTSTQCSLAELAAGLNRYACDHSGSGVRFTTAFLVEIQPASGRFEYLGAGHNPPFLLRRDGSYEKLDSQNIPFGVRREETYITRENQIDPGDILAIYTDGVVEAINSWGEEYDELRLISSLLRLSTRTAQEIQEGVMRDLLAFAGSTRQQDDITLLILRRA